jgi:hypothetical protein
MHTVTIQRAHPFSSDRARALAEQMAREVASRFGYVLDWQWQDGALVFEGTGLAKGARGRIDLPEGVVIVTVTLPPHLRFKRERVEFRVNERLDALLKGAAAR